MSEGVEIAFPSLSICVSVGDEDAEFHATPIICVVSNPIEVSHVDDGDIILNTNFNHPYKFADIFTFACADLNRILCPSASHIFC